jgi:hypothetical protein
MDIQEDKSEMKEDVSSDVLKSYVHPTIARDPKQGHQLSEVSDTTHEGLEMGSIPEPSVPSQVDGSAEGTCEVGQCQAQVPQSLRYTNSIWQNKNTGLGQDGQGLIDISKPVMTRSQRKSVDTASLALFDDWACLAEAFSDPNTFDEAMTRSDWEQWRVAVGAELDAMVNQQVFKLVPKTERLKPISCRWVFRVKRKSDGSVDRYKARLVAKGFTQKRGQDFTDTFAPVVRFDTLRTMVAAAATMDLLVFQSDVETAFLNAELHEDNVMEIPDGFEFDLNLMRSKRMLSEEDYPVILGICLRFGKRVESGKFCATSELRKHVVLRLQKCIYGLHQSPREWNHTLNNMLIGLDFVKSEIDPCLYWRKIHGDLFWVLTYVDDIFQFSKCEEHVRMFQNEIDGKLKLKHLGEAQWLLGIEVLQDKDRGTIALRQRTYIEDIAKRFEVANAKACELPAIQNEYLSATEGVALSGTDVSLFRAIVGSLMYAVVGTRPDIANAVRAVAKFMSEPTSTHLEAAKRVIKYLLATKEECIVYKRQDKLELMGYADADWGNDKETRKSVSGCCFMMSGAAITWSSTQQPIVALSSCEAEYVALSMASQQAIYLKNLIESAQLSVGSSVMIYEDNQSCIALTKDHVFRKRTKHMDVRYHFVRHNVIQGTIQICYCPTENMIADILTKPLAKNKYKKFKNLLLGNQGACIEGGC